MTCAHRVAIGDGIMGGQFVAILIMSSSRLKLAIYQKQTYKTKVI